MGRYRKTTMNEQELEEIDGITPVLRPTRDEVFQVIETFGKQQKEKNVDLKSTREVLTGLLYNSLFVWEEGKRTNKKEAGCEDITREDIDDYVVKNIFELWLSVLNALKIIDKNKLEEMQKQMIAKQSEVNANPQL
jgi:hypothetical protein